jgi:hypothetical protein
MKMTHPKSKGTIDVLPSQVENAKNKGWVEYQSKPKPKFTNSQPKKED